jgi:hypothetical protein
VLNRFTGRRRDSARLFSATPPAIPASAAPPATRGVLAFEATFATFSPAVFAWGLALEASSATFSVVFSTGPFEDWLRLVLARDARAPLRLVDLLLLVELFVLGRLLRVDRLLEERVVWAIALASLGFHASCAFRAGGASRLPARVMI